MKTKFEQPLLTLPSALRAYGMGIFRGVFVILTPAPCRGQGGMPVLLHSFDIPLHSVTYFFCRLAGFAVPDGMTTNNAAKRSQLTLNRTETIDEENNGIDNPEYYRPRHKNQRRGLYLSYGYCAVQECRLSGRCCEELDAFQDDRGISRSLGAVAQSQI
jgi:hypothetical protein